MFLSKKTMYCQVPSCLLRLRVWQRPTWVSEELQRSEVTGKLVLEVRPRFTNLMLSFK